MRTAFVMTIAGAIFVRPTIQRMALTAHRIKGKPFPYKESVGSRADATTSHQSTCAVVLIILARSIGSRKRIALTLPPLASTSANTPTLENEHGRQAQSKGLQGLPQAVHAQHFQSRKHGSDHRIQPTRMLLEKLRGETSRAATLRA